MLEEGEGDNGNEGAGAGCGSDERTNGPGAGSFSYSLRYRTRKIKNSRYDKSDYFVDYSGSGQPNKYKLRKRSSEDNKVNDVVISTPIAITMHPSLTSDLNKQMPTETSKKQPNKRQMKHTRKEREKLN